MSLGKKLILFGVLALVGSSIIQGVRAQDEDELDVVGEDEEEGVDEVVDEIRTQTQAQQQPRGASSHPLTNLPPSHPDVQFSSILPEFEDNVLARGKVIDALFGIINDAASDVLVYSVAGSLNHGMSFDQYLQNFTMIGYNQTIEADNEASFLYRFFPSPFLEPGEYIVALTAFYAVDNSIFSTTFFNQTVKLAEEEFTVLNSELLTNVIMGVVVAGAILYFLFNALNASPSTRVSTEKFASVKDEWVNPDVRRTHSRNKKRA